MRLFVVLLFVFMPLLVQGGKVKPDTVGEPQRKQSFIRRIIRGFDKIDTTYIEPQHYNWSVMVQALHELDRYTISSNGQSITLAPDPTVRVGPYFGWRWVFSGYSFDLNHLSVGGGKLKMEFDFSIYTSQICLDVFHRRAGRDYKLRELSLGDHVDLSHLEGEPYDGVKAGITGINAYYIFNHGRFSYPAAFSQSTLQKVSCGSWIAGAGFTQNTLDFDYNKLQTTIDRSLGYGVATLDSGLLFRSIRYIDVSLSGGYAWNQVFGRHWLFCASVQAALAYKNSRGNIENHSGLAFSFDRIHIDGVGRFALVYNNMRWYFGTSAILRLNNYRTSRFRSSNFFGDMNLYLGYNFGLRKNYRK